MENTLPPLLSHREREGERRVPSKAMCGHAAMGHPSRLARPPTELAALTATNMGQVFCFRLVVDTLAAGLLFFLALAVVALLPWLHSVRACESRPRVKGDCLAFWYSTFEILDSGQARNVCLFLATQRGRQGGAGRKARWVSSREVAAQARAEDMAPCFF